MKPDNVMETLSRVMLVDGYDLVIDPVKSQGSRLVDARNGRSFLDMFTMFASLPLGMNHPRVANPEFIAHIGGVAVNKPANSDIYSAAMGDFVDKFSRIAAPKWTKHLFFVSGGALAVENAMKVAFDWKVRKNQAKGVRGERGSQVLHFKEGFHGRSGYTLSLTNTDPAKTKYFPKFDWPRVDNPKMTFPFEGDNVERTREAEARSLAQIAAAIKERGADDIAALIIEPIQGEGGDNHFRPEFMGALRAICDEHEIFFILDEVQTGMGMTGRWWAHEHHGIEPDALAFGKKAQVCGIAVGPRVDEVENNCFQESSRINSTWGGNLVDMVRCARFVEIIDDEKLVENASERGCQAMGSLKRVFDDFPGAVTNLRAQGLFIAFDLAKPELRASLLQKTFENGLMVLPSGKRSIRLRPALNVTAAEIDEGAELLGRSLRDVL